MKPVRCGTEKDPRACLLYTEKLGAQTATRWANPPTSCIAISSTPAHLISSCSFRRSVVVPTPPARHILAGFLQFVRCYKHG